MLFLMTRQEGRIISTQRLGTCTLNLLFVEAAGLLIRVYGHYLQGRLFLVNTAARGNEFSSDLFLFNFSAFWQCSFSVGAATWP